MTGTTTPPVAEHLSPPRPETVDAATVAAWASADPDGVVVVDVRSPDEFEAAHIAGSFNVPLEHLGEHAAAFAARLDRPVVLVCRSGARAAQARQRLAAVGAENLSILSGGVAGFAAAGGPVVRGRRRWAMERQVRLTAGTLVAGSIALSVWRPRARYAAGAVGAGLTWSAISDTCSMARVLGWLPWNRTPVLRTPEQLLADLPPRRTAA